MSTQANAATTTAGSAAPPADFDAFAAETLGIGGTQESQTQGATGGDAGDAGTADAAQTGTKAPNEAAAAATGTVDQAQQEGQTGSVKQDEWAIDQALLDKVLADPTHGAIVKALNEKYQKALESVRIWGPEAADAKALMPGGLSELKETVEFARGARQENADFMSGDPARQKSALSSLAEDAPEQFVNAMPLFLEVAAQKNPQAYQQHMERELRRSLETDGVPALLQNFFTALAGDADKPEDARAFAEAAGALREWADKAGFTQAPAAKASQATAKDSPEVAALKARLKEYEDKDSKAKATAHEATAKAWGEFQNPTNEAVSKGIREAAKPQIEALFPKNTETQFKEFVSTQILDKVEAEIISQLVADLGHQDKINAILANNAWRTDAARVRQQIVNLKVGRGTQLLPALIAKYAKQIAPGAMQAAVDNAATKTSKEKAAAARADVTGAGGSNRTKTWTVKDAKNGGALSRMSEDDILAL